jgi:hypothetical protein
MDNTEVVRGAIITKTDVLTMEYVELPVIDLSCRFMYRFITPVEALWVESGAISNHFMAQSSKNFEEALELFAAQAWEKMVKEAHPDGLPEESKWLLDIKKVNLIECVIVNKEAING